MKNCALIYGVFSRFTLPISCLQTALIGMCLLCVSTHLPAQDAKFENVKKREKTIHNCLTFGAQYAADFPVGVLQQRFGFTNNMGAILLYRLQKNWMIGAEGSFLYSSTVKEKPIQFVASLNGSHITVNGDLTDISPSLNGFTVKAFAGKLFAFSQKNNPGTGILLQLGGGFLQHRIYYNVNPAILPQFTPALRTGYDRLCYGGVVSISAAFIRMERHKFLNMMIGPHVEMAVTENRRSWDFAEMKKLTGTRLDMLVGLKIALLVPIFLNKDNEDYFE